jgi:hypothetical protein
LVILADQIRLFMKKTLLIIFLTSMCTAYAQLGYTLSKSNSPFVNLSSGTNISVAAWNSSHNMALPFQFRYFGNLYNNLYITYDGFFFSDTGDDYLFYGTDNYMPQNATPALSPISFETIGTAPNRILKVQWLNVREFTVDTASHEYTLNNQMWLYENGYKIEYHFGNNTITDPNFTSFYIGIIDYDNSPYLAIDGSVDNPLLVRVLNAGTFDGISAYPGSGLVYTLTPETQVSVQTPEKPYSFGVTEKGFLLLSESLVSITLTDVSGKQIAGFNPADKAGSVYNTEGIAAGIYLVNFQIGNRIFSEKIALR